MSAARAAAALLVFPLAGCAFPWSDDCASVRVPALAAGSSFTYAIEGGFGSPGIASTISWGAIGGAPDDAGFHVADPGDHVVVVVGGAPSRMLAWNGTMVQALQATYWYHSASRGLWAPFADEWIDPHDGSLLQATGRIMQPLNGTFAHLTAFTQTQFPYLLLAPMAWFRAWEPGARAWWEIAPAAWGSRTAVPQAT